MCQALSEGGRRCPIHRRDTILTISQLSQTTSLNPEQTKQVFLDLRKEGRGLRIKDSESYWHGYLDSLEINASESAQQEIEGIRKDEAPDSATLYALRNLRTRVKRKSAVLEDTLDDVARRKGWTLESTKEKFEQKYQSLVSERSRTNPRTQVEEARAAGLPTDRFTVAALSHLEEQSVEQESVRRVQLETLADGTQAGYHEGRLEAILPGQDRSQALAYRDVDQDVWETVQQSDNPGRMITHALVGDPHHQYSTAEESRSDAYQVRCEACGQFRAQQGTHDCPAVREAKEAAVREARAAADDTDEPNEAAIQAQLNPPEREQPAPDYEGSTAERYLVEPLSPRLIEAQLEDNWIPSARLIEQANLYNEESTTLQRALLHYNEQTREVEYLGDGRNFERRFVWGAIGGSRQQYYRVPTDGNDLEPSTQEKVDETVQWIEDQEEQGKLVIVPSNATAARRYKVDGNSTSNAKIAYARLADFRREIKEGKIVSAPIEWDMRRNETGRDAIVDDQGYGTISQRGMVNGQLVLRQRGDGTFEVPEESVHSLRCTCYKYRRDYRCEHVSYALRHAGNLGQQMYDGGGGQGGARGGQRATVATPFGQVPAGFVSQPYVSIVEDSEHSAGGYINIAEPSRRRRSLTLSTGVPLPASIEEALNDEDSLRKAYLSGILYGASGYLPAANLIKRSLRYGDTKVNFSISPSDRFTAHRSSYGRVEGSMTLGKDEDGKIVVKERDLQCSCYDYARNYRCIHTQASEAMDWNAYVSGDEETERTARDRYSELRNHLFASTDGGGYGGRHLATDIRQSLVHGVPIAEARAAAAAERQAEEEAYRRREEERRERIRQERIDRQNRYKELRAGYDVHRNTIANNWVNREPGYAENPQEFKEDYQAALRRKRNKESAVPFRTEGVLDGMSDGDRKASRAFGVELEFVIGSNYDRRRSLQAIARDLHAAGLTEQSSQAHYHAAQTQSGGAYSKWSFEEDATVDGELVSPLLKDTPEDWNSLKTALDIIKKHGGQTSTRAGSHVHVSTGSYEDSTSKHAELLRSVTANEDVLYRMASDPARGKHRGTDWCSPNVERNNDSLSKEVKDGHRVLGSHGHGNALNLSASGADDPGKSHVELRVWDATLDPGIVQAQIATSVALVERAEREVETKGVSEPPASRQRLGTAAARYAGKGRKSDAEFFEENSSAAQFIDSLFRRKEDRAQATALFAVNNWAKRG